MFRDFNSFFFNLYGFHDYKKSFPLTKGCPMVNYSIEHSLKEAGLVAHIARVVKVVKTGELTIAVKLNGIGATAGAKAAIEAAGGTVA
jgi:hypothetical protein